jgi:hypothetical protein
MAKISGWQAKLMVSGDGGSNFYEVGQVTSGSPETSINTEDNTVWQDDGFTNEVPVTVSGTFAIEGLYDTTDDGQSIVEAKALAMQPVFCRFYREKTNLNRYYEFSGWVSKWNVKHEATGKAKFTFDLNVKGKVVRVGY